MYVRGTKLHLKFSEPVCFDTLNISTFIYIAIARYFRKPANSQNVLGYRVQLPARYRWMVGVSVSKFSKARVGVCTGQAAGGKLVQISAKPYAYAEFRLELAPLKQRALQSAGQTRSGFVCYGVKNDLKARLTAGVKNGHRNTE